MCGIFGHTRPGRYKQIASRKALHTISHRGPDQWNDWQDKSVYFGHRRLSIMDLSENGRQPMTSADGQVVLTVNGEIYNFEDLKAELQSKYAFKSNSDSEVMVYGYLEWGIEELIRRMEGIYAFSLYDAGQQKLYLGVDRVGVKPLYYSRLGDGTAWASELKALQELHQNDDLRVDNTAVYDYLTYLYVPAPKSLYQNIFKLEPAHYLTIDLATDQLTDTRYWQLKDVNNRTDVGLDEAAKTVHDLVREAVKEQLMSDVPVGFFLSGGMDSSTVVAAAAAFSSKIHTYAIGFDVKEHDETHFAQLVAKRYKTKHTRKEVSADQVKDLFPKIKEWYDEPFADTSAFPVYLVSSLTKPTSTVVLTGDGGDEVFGGYNWYTHFVDEFGDATVAARRGVLSRLKGLFDKDDMVSRHLTFYTTLLGGLTKEAKADYRRQFNIPAGYDDYWHFRKYYRPELPVLTRLQFLDFHTYLPGDILTKVDRASMAVALECRVPLLATRVIEYVFSLPESIRYRGGELKGLMKYAFRDDLPEEILSRDKKGFSIPTGRWKSQLMEKKMPMPEFILTKLFSELEA